MLYKQTNTLDGLIDDVPVTADRAVATCVLLGSKALDVDAFPRLRGIFRVGVGTENVPWAAAKARGLRVGLPSTGTAEIIYRETASFTCYLILQAVYGAAGTLEGWIKHPRREIGVRTLLVIGLGHIGRRVATQMSSFMPVTTYDVLENAPDDLPRLLAGADIVTLHVPLTDATRGMVGARELAQLRDGATIINTARGALVDEAALLAELQRGRVRASFDVFWKEPYAGPLAALPADRFHMTPHVASTCDGFLVRLADDLRQFMRDLETPA